MRGIQHGTCNFAGQIDWTEQLGLSVLGRSGIGAIWRLNVAAADAYRTGHSKAAAALLGIAEAAEEAWLRAEGNRSVLCCSKSS
jgi:hypothetical protein